MPSAHRVGEQKQQNFWDKKSWISVPAPRLVNCAHLDKYFACPAFPHLQDGDHSNNVALAS